jgi:hypothetical protein
MTQLVENKERRRVLPVTPGDVPRAAKLAAKPLPARRTSAKMESGANVSEKARNAPFPGKDPHTNRTN